LEKPLRKYTIVQLLFVGGETLKKTAVYDWSKRFKNGQESFEDEERSGGQPSTLRNNEIVENLV